MTSVRYFIRIMRYICNEGFQDIVGISIWFCRVYSFRVLEFYVLCILAGRRKYIYKGTYPPAVVFPFLSSSCNVLYLLQYNLTSS
jgi:hypothetical protein